MKKVIASLSILALSMFFIYNVVFAKGLFCKIEYNYNKTDYMKITLVSDDKKEYFIKGFIRENDHQLHIFYSDKKLSKGESSSILIPQNMFLIPVRVILSDEKSSLPFSDIASSPYKEYIWHLKSIGKIDGYGDGTFKPKNPITRQEFSKLVVNIFNIPVKLYQRYSFVDIKKSWARNEIESLYQLGYINGFKDKSGKVYFKPDDKISYEQAISIVCRILKIKSSGSLQNFNSWANEYISAAITNHILTLDDIKGKRLSDAATREWVCYLMSKSLVR